MVISVNMIVILVLLALVGYLGSKWLLQKDVAVVERHRSAAKLAARLRAYGLIRVPDLLIDYSVTDVAGMGSKVKAMSELSDEEILSELRVVFDHALVETLKTEAGRALIASKLFDAVKPDDTSVIRTAPVPATK